MRNGLPSLCLLSVVAFGSGCIESALNPEDDVKVTGTALGEDKAPLAGKELSLSVSDNSACLITKPYTKTTTKADGTFELSLKGRETQNGELARCFQLGTAGEGGSGVSTEFLMQVTEVEIPTQQVWSGTIVVADAGADLAVSFKAIGETHPDLSSPSYSLTLQRAPAGTIPETVWRKTGATTPVALSAEVLEDFSDLSAVVRSFTEVKGSGTTFKQSHRAKDAALVAKGKVPASRGASCTAVRTGGSICAVTDGKVETYVVPEAVTEVKVTLAAAKSLKKAVLRGFTTNPVNPSELVLEGSTDGSTWVALADLRTLVGDGYVETALSNTAPAVTHVRIRGASSDANVTFRVSGLDELSLFE